MESECPNDREKKSTDAQQHIADLAIEQREQQSDDEDRESHQQGQRGRGGVIGFLVALSARQRPGRLEFGEWYGLDDSVELHLCLGQTNRILVRVHRDDTDAANHAPRLITSYETAQGCDQLARSRVGESYVDFSLTEQSGIDHRRMPPCPARMAFNMWPGEVGRRLVTTYGDS